MSEGSILLVSNEFGIARALRLTLAAKGYEVTTVESLAEAVELSESGKRDLVLLDCESSAATLEACREIRACSDVAIVVVSSDGSEDKRARASLAGADDYVLKPFGINEITGSISANIHKSKTASRSRYTLVS
jgi:two-component system KDP operon response regulator KdpE